MSIRGVKTLEDRSAEKDKKMFQDDIQYFLSKETFTIFDFHERTLHGLAQKSSFRMMLVGNDTEFKALEN